jgi:hypothetical protein
MRLSPAGCFGGDEEGRSRSKDSTPWAAPVALRKLADSEPNNAGVALALRRRERAAKKWTRFFAPTRALHFETISFSAFERFRSNAG